MKFVEKRKEKHSRRRAKNIIQNAARQARVPKNRPALSCVFLSIPPPKQSAALLCSVIRSAYRYAQIYEEFDFVRRSFIKAVDSLFKLLNQDSNWLHVWLNAHRYELILISNVLLIFFSVATPISRYLKPTVFPCFKRFYYKFQSEE